MADDSHQHTINYQNFARQYQNLTWRQTEAEFGPIEVSKIKKVVK